MNRKEDIKNLFSRDPEFNLSQTSYSRRIFILLFLGLLDIKLLEQKTVVVRHLRAHRQFNFTELLLNLMEMRRDKKNRSDENSNRHALFPFWYIDATSPKLWTSVTAACHSALYLARTLFLDLMWAFTIHYTYFSFLYRTTTHHQSTE